ncbi:MAG TPA: hypothetical protein PLR20_13885 [Syntrophales bacterium]|nr:hypothetical protein [Syntrophales bacterium]HQM30435.1 hypothetical protein [Syntrophales bacterium]
MIKNPRRLAAIAILMLFPIMNLTGSLEGQMSLNASSNAFLSDPGGSDGTNPGRDTQNPAPFMPPGSAGGFFS